MAIESWGFRFVVVEHRPLVLIWVTRDDGHDQYVASPGEFARQLGEARDVAEMICDAELFYEHLVATGLFRNLDEIDQECRDKFAGLEFVAPAPRRNHD